MKILKNIHITKSIVAALLCTLLLISAVSALAVDFPVYGACTGERVNVRENPELKVPSKGRLIRHAPLVVLREEGDTYYCSTVFGEGYIPKQYVELFEGMTAEEYNEYSKQHPNFYRRYVKKTNEELYWEYLLGYITIEELKDQWTPEPVTGYYGLKYCEEKDRYVYFRKWWW